MKLARFEHAGRIGPCVVIDQSIIDLSSSWETVLDIIRAGPEALKAITVKLATAPETIPLAAARLLAPIERPGKYLAIGMNYRKHVEEAARLGQAPPTKQFWFNKQTSCLNGPFDSVSTGVTQELDYEVELGIVIGSAAKNVQAQDALSHVFGYFVANDVSARDWQRHSPTFTMGKSFDTHGPIGPWIVTADEVTNPQDLELRCLVNGQPRQASNTRHMVHTVADQIAYLSTAFTLEPGDLIATGTPEGVGIAMQPPSFLQPGDIVRCEIDSIGAIENPITA